ncbi:LLM class flavin-dependent oxidoreductase [Cupriavidus oxalaticus]|uniref:LLM class flavin-dependent oxidoreductase n=1 Tax=Cupriavidus oxalaticus TaxID=96344 RepID=UPI003F73A1F8
MDSLATLHLSALDLAPITEGGSIAQTLRHSVELAQHVEALGFRRYWVAEHHNIIDIASAATAVIIGHIAAHTKSISVGSGGIMLPNHPPLLVAEQFGTLETLYPGRIDLGLGRAPGTDPETMRALRRSAASAESEFPEQVAELQSLFLPASQQQSVRAIPGAGINVPLWLLGSGTFTAQLAGYMGLPFVYAAHFSPRALDQALSLYRSTFRPSPQLNEPYVAVCVNIVAADTNAEAAFLATTEQQKFLGLARGTRFLLPPPVVTMDDIWSPFERTQVMSMLSESIAGDVDEVRTRLASLVERTGADEIMVNSWIHDHAARLRSYELIAQAKG